MHIRFKQSQPSWRLFIFFDNQQEPAKVHVNAPIHTVCTILKYIIASATETEIASAFINAQEAISIRYAVEFLGHKQPRTPMQVENTTAIGFTNDTIN